MLDIGFLAECEAASFEKPWSAGEIAAVCGDEYAVVETEEGVGYAVGRMIADEAELYRIAVMPDKRRGHNGTRLLKRFLDACRAKGAAKVFLEVRSKNVPAIGLYERAGFLRINTRKNYYGDDDALVYMLEFEQLQC